VTSDRNRHDTPGSIGTERRAAVLESALATFARFGYRKTSMKEVAQAARISRPGLYFLFASKEELFRSAVSQALEADIAEVERVLGQLDLPIRERLLQSFDLWAGRYIGPMTKDISAVVDDNPELLGDLVERLPRRFGVLITTAIEDWAAVPNRKLAVGLARTLISASIGIKYQARNRSDYRQRLTVAIDLLLR
jgi:AcrR family transcriptional regulator